MSDLNAESSSGLAAGSMPSGSGNSLASGDDIPELYQIESIEQLRAISDRLRMRIAELLGRRAMTVAQLSDELGLAHAKVHYHVRELEQVGLVRLVATREKSGILEKYYRAVARSLSISPLLLRSLPPDESVATIADFVQQILNDALRAFAQDLRATRPGTHVGTLSDSTLYLTDDEVRPLLRQVADLLKPYEEPRGREGEHERTFVHLLYSTPPPLDEPLADEPERAVSAGTTFVPAWPATPPVPPVSPIPPVPPRPPRPPHAPRAPRLPQMPAPPAAPNTSERPRRRLMVVVGLVSFSRADLEHAVARGEPIQINVLGRCHFDTDIPPELVDRAIARFRLRGTLDASPEVRAVLERKARHNQQQEEV